MRIAITTESRAKELAELEAETKDHDKSWIDKNDSDHFIFIKQPQPLRARTYKQLLVLFMALLFIGHSLFILIFTVEHIESAEAYCHSVEESTYYHVQSNGTLTLNVDAITASDRATLAANPELFVWNHCLYKVYPFTKNERHRCQCRVFEIDWDALTSTAAERRSYFNVSQTSIIQNALEHWMMIEKFRTRGTGSDNEQVHRLQPTEHRCPHLKAFEWSDASISSEMYGVLSWESLEYLSFIDTSLMQQLPIDLALSPKLKYLKTSLNGLQSIPEDICKLHQLRALELDGESMESIPLCLGEMTQLKALWVDACLQLTDVPLSIFNLPDIIELSLFNANIDYLSLLAFNIPDGMVTNDTEAIHEWFADHFHPNSLEDTTFWMSLNAICYEDDDVFPLKLREFVRATCTGNPCADERGDVEAQFCTPRQLGDGKCHERCQHNGCYWDYGDCAQLCFAEQLTNCSFAKFSNDRCDEGCNNKYCSLYYVGSDFSTPVAYFDADGEGIHAADRGECPLRNTSDYLMQTGNCSDSQCYSFWVNDGRYWWLC